MLVITYSRHAFRRFLAVLLACCYSYTTMAVADSTSPNYQLKPGDIIELLVWKEPELTRDLLVAPDGFISLPLAGAIDTNQKTTQQLCDEIKNKLAKFVNAPSVNISIKGVAGSNVYVLGKVNRPGEFILNQPLDVLQILSKAGGFTPYADADDIHIIRRNGKTQEVKKFNYGQIERGKNIDQNIMLQDGDTLIVP